MSLLPAVAIAASALAAAPLPMPSFEREIVVDQGGRVAVRLDRDIYEGARADLGDLRVVDGHGREVPYVVDRGEAGHFARECQPARDDAFVPGHAGPPLREEPLVPRWSAVRDARVGETWLALDLGARYQPFVAVELDVADDRFFREVRVEVRREPPTTGAEARWEELGRSSLHRMEHEGRRRERLRVLAAGRGRALRVRVRDRDDRPLQVRGVTVRVPVEQLLFVAAEPGRHRLTYGSASREAPSYDLACTAGDLGEWAETARPARLGPPRRLAPAGGEERPWTERHPSLLWVGLVAAVAALGALTYGALRRAG